MKLVIDTEARQLVEENGTVRQMDLYSREAFETLSQCWLKVGWNEKYTYTFSWFGRPIIQLPDDLMRMQELIYQVKPDVIVETGVAHGGSLIFYATLCKALGRGRVIGIDIEIRPHNRLAIEQHEFASLVTLIEGSSIDARTLDSVKALVQPHERALVILDSCHEQNHVRAELEAYHPFVSVGSYIVATDGIMQHLHDVPRGQTSWKQNHPSAAAQSFLETHPEFILEQPRWPFNESELRQNVTHWPGAWLKRTGNSTAP